MSSYGPWTIPAAGTGLPAQEKISQKGKLYGKDIFFDTSDETGANTKTSPSGDWLTTSGREALRQALIRRIITNPGEWQTLPEYGVGARLFIKARNTRAARDELTERIRGQLRQETRVESVDQVNVEFIDSGLKISVVVTPVGEPQRSNPLTASVEIS